MRDNRFPHHVTDWDAVLFFNWKTKLNVGNVYIFNYVMKNYIQQSTNSYLQSQETQVAKSHIKHADKHWCTDLCLEGCFCAAEHHQQSWLNFIFLLPPLLVSNGAVPTLSVYCTPLWVWECSLWKEMDKGGRRDTSASPLTDYMLLFCVWKKGEGGPLGQL